VNDPPTMGSEYLQNQQMNEGETKVLAGTMDDKKYFQDIEGDTLYYKGAIDPDNKFNGEDQWR